MMGVKNGTRSRISKNQMLPEKLWQLSNVYIRHFIVTIWSILIMIQMSFVEFPEKTFSADLWRNDEANILFYKNLNVSTSSV